ncbi:MAG: hypothetical protein RBR67_05720 [Desulfobacterium sp.]|nr:hypothetical protein [Desulfobacterium sp.]
MAKKKDRWLFPTNTNNLRMILAQGLLASPDGFKKYYADALDLQPGWVPIYRNKIPRDVLEKCVSERENLTPCIIEVNIDGIRGTGKTYRDGEWADVKMGGINTAPPDSLYVPAPLPLSCFLKLIFKTDEDQKQFEDIIKQRANVILAGLKLQSTKQDQKLFKFSSTGEFEPELLTLPGSEKSLKSAELTVKNGKSLLPGIPNRTIVNYNTVYSFGGLLLNMFYFSKNGESTNQVYHCISASGNLSESVDKGIHFIDQHFKRPEREPAPLAPGEQIYYGLMDIAINSENFKQDIIDFLESDKWDEKIKPRVQGLAATLKDFEKITDKTVSEQFKEAETGLGKILLMLFLREDSDALIDYKFQTDILNDHTITEELIIQFAMLFGIRAKFIKSPGFIREFEGVQSHISHQMATYAHLQLKSEVEFKPPQEPLTIMDMIRNNEFCKWFARTVKDETWLRTKITVPRGDYRLKVENSRIEITVDGIVKTPTAELIQEKYFVFMVNHRLADHDKFFKKYKRIKQ